VELLVRRRLQVKFLLSVSIVFVLQINHPFED
jgi:hypothetical protein